VRAVVVLFAFLLGCSVAAAQSFIVQGSTTFTHRIMDAHLAEIEMGSGHRLTVIPNKSSLGLLALFEKRADFAMISGPLENEVEALKQSHPDFDYGRLRSFNVWSTRMAFAVNKDNPVRHLDDDKMRDILLGVITNWKAVGGQDLPIRIVHVRDGGGVQASVEALLLGKSIGAKNVILVQISSQVVKIVAQLPEALGLSQLTIVRNSNAAELTLDHPVEQHLNLVTLGDPTPEMMKVIEAARRIEKTATPL
jgi:ABC-type phosphate transport system substrate-binding protein